MAAVVTTALLLFFLIEAFDHQEPGGPAGVADREQSESGLHSSGAELADIGSLDQAGEPAPRVALDAPLVPPESTAWIRAAPTLDLESMSGREVLEAYWGEEWPEVEAYLGERLRIVDTYWAGQGEELGQPEDVLDSLVEELLDDLNRGGGPPRRISALCNADPSPFHSTRTLGKVLALAMEIAGRSGPVEEAIPPRARQDLEVKIQQVCRPLANEWQVLDACVRDLIASQLSDLDRFRQPEVGYLTICPLMNFGPPPEISSQILDEGSSRWFIGLTAFAKDRLRCKFVAQWCVDFREDPACMAAIESIQVAESLAAAELESLAFSTAAEFE